MYKLVHVSIALDMEHTQLCYVFHITLSVSTFLFLYRSFTKCIHIEDSSREA